MPVRPLWLAVGLVAAGCTVKAVNAADPVLAYPCEELLDAGANGSIDGRVQITFHASGKPALKEHDEDGDGSWDSRTRYHHDEAGRLVRKEVDEDADGEAESVTIYLREAAGEVTEERTDSDGDGKADTVVRLSRDAEGRETRREVWRRTAGELELQDVQDLEYGAGQHPTRLLRRRGALPPVIHAFERDADGRLLAEVVTLEGKLTARTAYDYVHGELRVRRWDSDGDGRVDTTWSYSYDADGNLIQLDRDDGGDGTVEHRRRFRYRCTATPSR